MKFYVGSKFEEAPRAAAFMRQLEADGHRNMYDWAVNESSTPAKDYPKLARLDLDAAQSCHVFILLWHPGLRGGLVEMGAALACENRVIVVGAPPDDHCIFYKLVDIEHFETEAQVRELLLGEERTKLAKEDE